MKIFRIMYALLGVIFLAYGITLDSKVMQIVGTVFTFTVWLWEFFLREEETRKWKRDMERRDEALNVRLDEEGNVVNNPFNFGNI